MKIAKGRKKPGQDSAGIDVRVKNILGPRIKRFRLLLQPPLRQQDLADKVQTLGVSLDQTAIARIEAQERFLNDIEIEAIAKALGTTVAVLFDSNLAEFLLSGAGATSRQRVR